MPDIRVTCPTCKTQLEIDAVHEGEEVECGNCLQVFVATVKKTTGTGSGTSGSVRGSTARSRERSRDDEDDRPRRRRPRDDDDDDDYDDRPRRRDDDDDYRPQRADAIPSQPVAGMLLGGGIWALLLSLLWIVLSGLTCCIWPGTWFAIVWGILAIVNASGMLGKRVVARPKAILIMQIVQIVNLDVINLILGIIGLTSSGDRDRGRRYD